MRFVTSIDMAGVVQCMGESFSFIQLPAGLNFTVGVLAAPEMSPTAQRSDLQFCWGVWHFSCQNRPSCKPLLE